MFPRHFLKQQSLLLMLHRNQNTLASLPKETAIRKFEVWMKMYEDFVGLTVVKQAQHKVIEAESYFLEVQQARREKQRSLSDIQTRLKKLNSELDKIPRTDDKYLKLLTEEHSVIKDEQSIFSEVDSLETQERQQFSVLSTALRDSHEKESAQSERTKYWSVAGSVIGALIGIIGTTVNNRLRMRELKSMMLAKASAADPELQDKLDTIQTSLDQVSEKITQTDNADDNPNTNLNNNLADNSTSIDECKTQMITRIDEMEWRVFGASIVGAACGSIFMWLISKVL